jgi:hypothetical protein
VRPSEKTTFHAIPGLAKQAPLSPLGRSVEGRAPHARKESITLTPTLPLLGHRLLGKAPVATQCLAIRPAVPCGRGDRVPPRKSPFASSPALSRKAVSHRLTLSEGRAPHARWEGLRLTEARVLLATGSSSTHPVGIRYLGIPPAVTGGRTECAPPRKPSIPRVPCLAP